MDCIKKLHTDGYSLMNFNVKKAPKCKAPLEPSNQSTTLIPENKKAQMPGNNIAVNTVLCIHCIPLNIL